MKPRLVLNPNPPPTHRMTCPKCGCGDLPVAYIRHRSGDAKRVRECRHCGQRLRTTETIVGLVT